VTDSSDHTRADRLVGALDGAAARAAGALPPRFRSPALRRVRLVLQRGRRVTCPVCGHGWRRFMPAWNRPDAICWWCGAHERHRALWLYLHERTSLFAGAELSVLHFSPEHFLERALAAQPRVRYLSADLEPGAAMAEVDITAIPYAEASFDVVICSHVLEHVEDDRRGVRELFRVLRPGGFALVLVPLDHDRAETYEDPQITTPAEREQAYWQHDHLRLYGRDFGQRLAEAGFTVEGEDFVTGLGEDRIARHALLPTDRIFRATRPEPPPSGARSLTASSTSPRA
jgi:SAM-dependent methyltransferase